jgi:hypothetical protein
VTTEEQEKLLNAGIQAARAGNKAEARRMLEQVLEEDDGNEQAWLVLASVVDTPRERRICLENVLEINPDNERAKQALAMLKPSPPSGPTPTPVVRPIASPTAASRSLPTRDAPIAAPTKRAGETTEGAQVAWRRQRAGFEMKPAFVFAALLALALMGIGLFLVTGTNVPPPDTPTLNPNETLVAVEPTLPGPTMTPTLAGTIVDIIPAGDNPPTWTPTFTRTPPPTVTLMPTLPPLSVYMLAFVGEGQGRKEPAIYAIGADGKNEKLLVGGDSKVFDPAISPDGKKLAYVTLVDNHEQLVVADVDGQNPQPITKQGGSRVRTPAWAPNSARIVFVSDEPGNDELYAINPDGTNLVRLTDNHFADLAPSYSPDGDKIVFSYDSTGKQAPQIFIMEAEPKPGSQAQQLTQSQGQNYSPAWSPDGKYVVFISTRSRTIPKVYIMRPDGSDERILTFDDADAQNRDPVWSPDGIYLAFSSTRNGGVFNIFIMTPDGKNVQQVTNYKDNAYSPRFLRGF